MILLFQLLVEKRSLVVLPAHRGCRVVDVSPITHMVQGDASGRHAGTRRLRALSLIPGMADINPREPNPLSPLQDNAGEKKID